MTERLSSQWSMSGVIAKNARVDSTPRLDQSVPLTGPHPRLVGSNRALHVLEHGRPRRFVPCPLDNGAAEHAEPKRGDTEQYPDTALVHRHRLLSLDLRS